MARSSIQPKKEQGRVGLKVKGKGGKGEEWTKFEKSERRGEVRQYRVKREKGRTPLQTMNSI